MLWSTGHVSPTKNILFLVTILVLAWIQWKCPQLIQNLCQIPLLNAFLYPPLLTNSLRSHFSDVINWEMMKMWWSDKDGDSLGRSAEAHPRRRRPGVSLYLPSLSLSLPVLFYMILFLIFLVKEGRWGSKRWCLVVMQRSEEEVKEKKSMEPIEEEDAT